MRESIIVHRLIQEFAIQTTWPLQFRSSTFPQFKRNNSPFTQKPIVTVVTLTPCFETQLPQLPELSQPVLEAIEASHRILIQPIEDIHRMWRHTCQKIAGAGPRLETALLRNTLPETAAGDLFRIFGWKKNRKCWYMFVGHTQVGMIIQGLGGTSNYQIMIEKNGYPAPVI